MKYTESRLITQVSNTQKERRDRTKSEDEPIATQFTHWSFSEDDLLLDEFLEPMDDRIEAYSMNDASPIEDHTYSVKSTETYSLQNFCAELSDIDCDLPDDITTLLEEESVLFVENKDPIAREDVWMGYPKIIV